MENMTEEEKMYFISEDKSKTAHMSFEQECTF